MLPDYEGSYSHQADYLSCVDQLKIDVLKKHSLSCYRGNIYLDRLDLGDEEIEAKITKCIKARYPEGCKTQIQEENVRENHKKIADCQAEVTGLKKVISKKDAYKITSDQIEIFNKKLCKFRYYHHVSNFSDNFKSAANCFTTAPDGEKLSNFTICFDKVFKSLKKNYDIDYILCHLFSGAINKVSFSISYHDC